MAIELAPGAGENGLALMMATMMSQNLADHPDRRPDFDRLLGRVAIVAEDSDVALTMDFERGRAVDVGERQRPAGALAVSAGRQDASRAVLSGFGFVVDARSAALSPAG